MFGAQAEGRVSQANADAWLSAKAVKGDGCNSQYEGPTSAEDFTNGERIRKEVRANGHCGRFLNTFWDVV